MARVPNTSPQTLHVLALLIESPTSWHYGYGISQRTGLRSGTLYPIFSRLVEIGWVETKWTEPGPGGRPARHTYRLTSDGAQAARQHVAAVAALKRPIVAASSGMSR